MKVYAIIPSGGVGKRINNPLPKQYFKFRGKELIAFTLDVFQNCTLIDEIIIASQKEYFALIDEIKLKNNFNKISKIVEGGTERQFSVFNAVKSIEANPDDIILVHDAVRPMLPQKVLIDSIDAAKEFGAAVVAMKAKDTLIRGNEFVQNYVDRSEFYYAQTPQAFKYKIFLDAMNKSESNIFLGTDESMLVKNAGYEVKIIEGSSLNFKITTEDDVKLFEKIYDYK